MGQGNGKNASVVSLSARIELDQKDHDKRVKVIEVSIKKNRTRQERP